MNEQLPTTKALMHEANRELGHVFERFLQLPTENLELALSGAADLIASYLEADKVDVFVHDPARATLVARGTSEQPLSALQKSSGLDIMPLANGGRVAQVFETGESFLSGDVLHDGEELRGVREVLRVQSQISVVVEIGDVRHGVLSVVSQTPSRWGPDDLCFTKAVARWVGIVAHRAQLMAELAQRALAEGRRMAAEELVTVVAHDLRSYLSPVAMRTHVLLQRAMSQERPDEIRDLELMLKRLARVDSFISDLLDVARLDHGLFELKRERLDLSVLVEDIASTTSTPQLAVQVESSESLTASVDALRIRQCLENLVGNAIKHSADGARVTMTLRREEREGESWACIEVSDQGPGIPEHLLPHIFDRFVTEQGSRDGLGLGLFLAKRIALMHHGDLTVDSTPGRGARFTLALPTGA